MSRPVSLQDVLALSPEQRLQLLEDIWDSLADTPEAVPLTEPQRRELDRRREAYRLNPRQGSTWPEVKARIVGDG